MSLVGRSVTFNINGEGEGRESGEVMDKFRKDGEDHYLVEVSYKSYDNKLCFKTIYVKCCSVVYVTPPPKPYHH